MATATSPFMLLFRETSPETYAAMSTEQRDQCVQNFYDWHDRIAAAGKMEHAHPLFPTGRVVSMPRSGKIVDGPFSEAKEFVGGYFLIHVADIEEATQIAHDCPSLQYGMIVEVRPVAPVCPMSSTPERLAPCHVSQPAVAQA